MAQRQPHRWCRAVRVTPMGAEQPGAASPKSGLISNCAPAPASDRGNCSSGEWGTCKYKRRAGAKQQHVERLLAPEPQWRQVRR